MSMNRPIASILAAITLVTSLPLAEWKTARAAADAAPPSSALSGADYHISSSNTFADYLTGAIEEEKNNTIAEESSGQGYTIHNVNFDHQTGKLMLQSSQKRDCKAVVSFTDEETGENAVVCEISVAAGENVFSEATIDVSELPAYYMISAELVGNPDISLCTPFRVNRYTKIMQEILAADIHDFDLDRVVTFDEREDTNFVVLSEDTVKVESTETENVLVSADYDNNVFVFENAEDAVKSLEEDEYFYIQPTEEDVIAIAVESVEVTEGQTIIKGDSAEIDDMFEFIKFETIADTGDAIVQESADNVDYTYVEDEAHPNGAMVYDPESLAEKIKTSNMASISKANGVRTMADDSTEPWGTITGNGDGVTVGKEFEIADGFTLTPSITLGFNLQFDYYKKRSYTDVVLKLETPIEIGVTASFEADGADFLPKPITAPLAYIGVPTGIPGVYIEIVPKFCLELSGEISVSYSTTPTFGFTYNTDNGLQSIENKAIESSEITVKAEGTVFVGLSLDPKCVIVHEKILSFGLESKVGLKISGSVEYSFSKFQDHSINIFKCIDTSGDTVHTCDTCITGEVSFYFDLCIDLTVLFQKIPFEAAIEIEIPLFDWYLSVDNEALLGLAAGAALPPTWLSAAQKAEFGFGSCPHIAYKTTFKVTNNNASMSGAEIKVGDITTTTGSGGSASLYATQGSHSYKVYVKGELVHTGTFTVEDSTVEVEVALTSTKDEDEVIHFTGSESTNSDQTYITTTTPEVNIIEPTVTTAITPVAVERNTAYQLGDNITGILYEDGYFWISGYGEMYDFTGTPLSDPASVKEVIIENSDEEGGLVITNIGDYVFANCSNMATIEMPASITDIGNYAFYGCSSLSFEEQLDMSGVMNVGDYAFCNCSLIPFGEVVLSDSLQYIGTYAFANCDGMTSVMVPDSVLSIGKFAFQACSALETAVVGNVGSIAPYVFDQCTALESLTLPYAGGSLADVNAESSVVALYAYLFYYAVSDLTYNDAVPNSLKEIHITGGTRIPASAFYNFSKVTTITIPESITSIGDSAFAECHVWEGTALPEGLLSIGAYAFTNCKVAAFGDLVLPTQLQSIGTYAFANCDGMTSVMVPDSVLSIGKFAFQACSALETAVVGNVGNIAPYVFDQCTALESLTLPYAGGSLADVNAEGSTVALYAYLFYYAVTDLTYNDAVPNSLKEIHITGGTRIPTEAFHHFNKVTTITIPDSITSIGDYAFAECHVWEGTALPEGLLSIGAYAFTNCKVAAFGDLVLPTQLQSIGTYAFANCDGMTSVMVPDSVLSIGKFAFQACSALKTAVVGNVGSIAPYVFDQCTALESLTLPYAGGSLADVNAESSAVALYTYLFYYAVTDLTYNDAVPNSLKEIHITGGTRIPTEAFYHFNKVTTITIPDSITSIGDYAFAECHVWEGTALPEGLLSIGAYAFTNCKVAAFGDLVLPTQLQSIGIYAFANCDGMTSVMVPDSVLSIGKFAFQACSALNTAVIGDVDSIGSSVFDQCTALESLTLPYAGGSLEGVNAEDSAIYLRSFLFYYTVSGETYDDAVPISLKEIHITGGERIPTYAFSGMSGVTIITIPDSVTTIGNYAYEQCWSLVSVDTVLPDTVTSIGEYAFYNCSALPFGDYTFSESLLHIGMYAFFNCDGMTSVTIPDTVSTIGKNAFENCSKLNTAVVGDVDSIGSYIFDECTALESLTLPYAGGSLEGVNAEDSAVYLRSFLFYNSVSGKTYDNAVPISLKEIHITGGERIPTYAFSGMSGVTIITIPDSVTTIGNYAYEQCWSLVSIDTVLPDTVTSIGEYAFYNCSALPFGDYAFSDSLLHIGMYAFFNCDGMTSVTIPDTVSTIGKYAFENCSKLNTAVVGDVDSIGSYIFDECTALESLTLPYAGGSLEGVNAEDSAVYLRSFLFYNSVSGKTYDNAVPISLKEIHITGGERIPTYAFSGMSGVTIITIPDNITTIGNYAYEQCWSLISIDTVLPDTVTSIGEYAFYNCSALPFGDYAFSDSLLHIGMYAFFNCDGMTSVTIPDTVSTIGKYAFENCSKLNTAVIGDVDSIGSYIFDECTALESLTLPYAGGSLEGVNAEDSAIYLRSFLFYNSVSGRTFANAVPISLKEIYITGGERIPTYAFSGMSGLTTITIPAGITTVGSYAFEGCRKLSSLLFMGDAPVFASDAFSSAVATAYYMTENDNWTSDVLQAYGGRVTWIGRNPLVIVAQPADASAYSGESAATTVTATGDGLTYQWYVLNVGSTDFVKSSIQRATYSCKMSKAIDGRQVYCVITDQYGNSVQTETVTLTMRNPAVIVEQPADVRVANGEKAATTVIATGDGLTYQWYVLNVGSTDFVKSSIKKATYSCAMSEANDGRQVYCVITDQYGNSVQTETVTLTMRNPLVIVEQPTDVRVANGEKAATTVIATGDGLTYQWYVFNVGSIGFGRSSIKKATYSCQMCNAIDGRQVYCVITDQYGNSVQTETVTLTMCKPAVIVEQPADVRVANGEKAATTVIAIGDGLTYQWYVLNVGSTDFVKSSIKKATYSCAMSEANDGRQVYCVITDQYGNSVQTETVTLTMRKPAVIVEQPTDVSAFSGTKIATTVTATGDGLTYQWYVLNVGSTDFVKSSIKKATYSCAMSEANDGRQVYCVITDQYGNSVQTDTVTLTMCKPAVIVEQPTDVRVANGEKAATTVIATGDGLTYQWYVLNVGSTDFVKSSIKKATYSCAMSEANDGRQVYCVITDQYGNSVTTDTVTLTME